MVEPAKVALVCMPFYKAEVPTIALGLLKSLLREQGIASELHHLNLSFADLDAPGYREINDEVFFHGEWIFSHALWDEPAPTTLEAVTATLKRTAARFAIELARDPKPREPGVEPLHAYPRWSDYSQLVLTWIGRVEPFLQRCLDAIDWGRYAIVGFTSTFQQNVASLALAKRIKQRFPEVTIVFGGANCDGVMGEAMFRAFPFVDAVCLAEGDEVFPRFARSLLAGEPPQLLAGLLDRRLANPLHAHGTSLRVLTPTPRRPPYVALDTLPYPDYDEYFEQLAQTSFHDRPTMVYFESSRGCWYGQKQHCTFCGVNGSAIDFRTKSADRALAEILHLHDHYCSNAQLLAATDNIMPADYPRTMLPKLAELRLTTKLFYETKSNLRKDQVEVYHRAGVRFVQPGIESLSSRVLQLMKKGVSALQNIQTLKWCREYNIHAKWNVLYGFPGDSPDDYRDQAALFAKLHHLHAPIGCGPIRFDRFSPYQERPHEYGITNLRAHPGYRVIYRGLDDTLLDDLAYCFVGDYASMARIPEYDDQLGEAVELWQARADEAALFFLREGERVAIGDFRRPGEPKLHQLRGAAALVHTACDAIRSRAALLDVLERGGYAATLLDEILADLLTRDLMIVENERYLALAFEFHDSRSDDAYFPPLACWARLDELLRMLEPEHDEHALAIGA